MNQSIEHRVFKILAKTKKCQPQDIKPEQLIEDICEDSLDQVNLLFELEDEFDIDIPDEARELKTVQEIVAGVEKLVNAKQEQEESVA